MKVLVFGDIHGYTGTADVPTIEVVVDVVGRTRADLVLQVGDMCGYRPFSRPVYWIYGNHDALSMMEAHSRGESPVPNLRHIGTGEVTRLCVEGESVSFSGMNGAYDPICYYWPRQKVEDLGLFTEEDIEKCLTIGPVDIFLAHGCPSGLGFGREPDHGVAGIRRILETVRPRYMFCGHAHFFRTAQWNGSRVYSLDVASKEYYLLDTQSGELSVIGIDAEEVSARLGQGRNGAPWKTA